MTADEDDDDCPFDVPPEQELFELEVPDRERVDMHPMERARMLAELARLGWTFEGGST